jgi:hypothetical protein
MIMVRLRRGVKVAAHRVPHGLEDEAAARVDRWG